jgi:thiol-disulfide isomerase/thioredoxin
MDTGMNALSFSVGLFALQMGHLLVVVSLLAAAAAGRVADRQRHGNIDDVLLQTVLVAALVARLAFVALWFEQYRFAPWSLLDIRDGGFYWRAGFTAAGVYALVRGWRSPPLRKSLSSGLLAGVLVWGAANAMLGMNGRAPLPGVALMTMAGAPATLTVMAGKPTVVNLWASWCPPCRREMPVLAAAQQDAPQVNFVFVNQGEDAATAQRYLDDAPFTLDHVWLDQGASLGTVVGSTALPTTLFYDASGHLVDTHLGPLSAALLASKLAQFRSGSSTSGVTQ